MVNEFHNDSYRFRLLLGQRFLLPAPLHLIEPELRQESAAEPGEHYRLQPFPQELPWKYAALFPPPQVQIHEY
jgi:hypothetical protein